MKSSFLIHLLVIVVSGVAATGLARIAFKQEMDIDPILKNRVLGIKGDNGEVLKADGKDALSYVLGGFQKFASDVEWMNFINYSGSQNSINEDNVKEFTRRLEKIIALDPNFAKAYSVGALMLSDKDPDMAVKLMKKACDNEKLSANWEIPFYVGFILTQRFQNDERVQEAIPFLEKAVMRSKNPENYLVNYLVRAKAKAAKKKDKSLVNVEHAILKILFDEWRSTDANKMERQSLIPNLTGRMLIACQKAVASEPNNDKILKDVKEIREKVLCEQHLCEKCLAQYSAGDKFCHGCGLAVTVYGICPKCSSVMKGKFCSACGFNMPTPPAPPAAAAPAAMPAPPAVAPAPDAAKAKDVKAAK